MKSEALKLEKSNINQVIGFLNAIDIKYHKKWLKDTFASKNGFPGIKAASDLFSDLKIENIIVELPPEHIQDIPLPALALLKNKQIVTIAKVDEKNIEIFDIKNRLSSVGLNLFFEYWTGVLILAEKNDQSVQPGYADFKKKYVIKHLFRLFSFLLAVSIFMAFPIYRSIWTGGFIISTILIVLNSAGLLFTIYLINIQFDQASFSAKRFCSISRGSDCELVINSPASKIFGMSMSEWGVIYFGGCFITLFLFSLLNEVSVWFFYLKITSFLILPYTLFSVVYQWRVLKHWCPFCLSVMAVLWLEPIALLTQQSITFRPLDYSVLYIGGFLAACAIWLNFKEIYIGSLETKEMKRSLAYYEENKELQYWIFQKQPAVPSVPPSGIIIGRNNAFNTLTLLVKPNCAACMDSLDELMKSFDSQDEFYKMNINFLVSDKNSIERYVALVIISIYLENRSEGIQALKNWNKMKNFHRWNRIYGKSVDLKEAIKMLSSQNSYYQSLNISHAPFYIWNDKALPPHFGKQGKIPAFVNLIRSSERESKNKPGV